MTILIGWRYQFVEDNGDNDEWMRIMHLESPIYTTKQVTENAITLCKKRLIADAKKKMTEYISYQIDFEIKHQRNVNKFLCGCQKSLMSRYAEILRKIKRIEIVPVFAETTPTDKFFEYSTAD